MTPSLQKLCRTILIAVVPLLLQEVHCVTPAAFLGLSGSQAGDAALEDDGALAQWPFYHTSEELHSQIEEAVSGCKTGHATLSAGGAAGLDIVHVRQRGKKAGAGNASKPLAAFLFGEHARELFSAESAVHFVRELCGLEGGEEVQTRARKALAQSDFVILPNANPGGRRLVEQGHFCKRTNANGVDLNRNYGDHRDATQRSEAQSASQAGADGDDLGTAAEDNPGPEGFSEPETQDVRELLRERAPRLFLSVHTGELLLSMPFGFSEAPAPNKAGKQRAMLADINRDRCHGKCPYGGLAQIIGYKAKGCSMDYVVDSLNVPFAFTWEIYADKTLGDSTSQEEAAVQPHVDTGSRSAPGEEWSHLVDSFAGARFKIMDLHLNDKEQDNTKSSSVVMSKTMRSAMNEACFKRFNPHDEQSFNKLLDNWSAAYFDLADEVAAADPHDELDASAASEDDDSGTSDQEVPSNAATAKSKDPDTGGLLGDDDLAYLKTMR